MVKYVTRVGIINHPRKPPKSPSLRKRKPDLREAKVGYCSSPTEPTTAMGYKRAIRKETAKALKSEKIELEQLMKRMPLDALKSVYKKVSVTWERRIVW